MTRPRFFASIDRRAALRNVLAATKTRAGAKPYQILNAAGPEAEVRIYEEIAWYAINAEQFAQDLAQITAPVINLRINSPGGSVFDGLAIYNTLKAHSARVITHIDGIAASIASIIALAGDEVRVGQGAFVMIHDPWALVIGDAAAMRQEADLLDKVAGSLAGIYASRMDQPVADVRALMAAETWWTAEEAVAAGYATSLVEAPQAAAKTDRFDLSLFAKTPDALRTAPAAGTPKIETIRDFETFLRDVGGYSHATAKAIAAAGFKATSDPRDEDEPSPSLEPLASLAGELRSLFIQE